MRPPSDDAQVAGLRLRAVRALGRDAHAAAVDQRIGDVVFVVENRPVDGGDAHLVAVVLDAGDHATRDAARVERAFRHVAIRHIQRAEAEHVGVGDGARRDADHVADHAADAGVGSAERLQRGGVVVGLDFEGDFVISSVVKIDDAGVVHEGGKHPGLDPAFRWQRGGRF